MTRRKVSPLTRAARTDAARSQGTGLISLNRHPRVERARPQCDHVSMPSTINLFADLPRHLIDELFTSLHEAANIRIERILSHGHASSEGFWYDQAQHEWVILLKGAARLRLEGDDRATEMKPGDFLNIPAHRKHRVEWTTPDEPTVWLAVHYGEPR